MRMTPRHDTGLIIGKKRAISSEVVIELDDKFLESVEEAQGLDGILEMMGLKKSDLAEGMATSPEEVFILVDRAMATIGHMLHNREGGTTHIHSTREFILGMQRSEMRIAGKIYKLISANVTNTIEDLPTDANIHHERMEMPDGTNVDAIILEV